MYYVKTTDRHLRQMMPFIRFTDRLECELLHGIDIETGLRYSRMASAECYTIMDGSTPVGVFGVSAEANAQGMRSVWLVGTDRLTHRWACFARASRDIMDRFRHQYGTLYNVVYEKNTLHLRWLEWLGVDFYPDPSLQIVRFTSCA